MLEFVFGVIAWLAVGYAISQWFVHQENFGLAMQRTLFERKDTVEKMKQQGIADEAGFMRKFTVGTMTVAGPISALFIIRSLIRGRRIHNAKK